MPAGPRPRCAAPRPAEAKYLEAIPAEVLERDYGCGDPTKYVRPGETVLDLGSGAGKSCYIAAQVVGPEGRVIGVDCNRDMLALARRHLEAFAARVGYRNVAFHCGLIQDLKLDLDALAERLDAGPVRDQWGYLELRDLEDRLRREDPLIPDESIDCVISNCVLNLVRPEDKPRLFAEVFRVPEARGPGGHQRHRGRRGRAGRAAGRPRALERLPRRRLREDAFLAAFEAAGFHGISLAERRAEPWRTVARDRVPPGHRRGLQGQAGPLPGAQPGPGLQGSVPEGRGRRRPRLPPRPEDRRLRQDVPPAPAPPYDGMFAPVEPLTAIPPEQAAPFDCRRSARRHPRETKGQGYDATTAADGVAAGPRAAADVARDQALSRSCRA